MWNAIFSRNNFDRLLIAALFSILPAPIASAQVQWTEITTNAAGDRFLVDQNSIQVNGNSVWYWQYRDFPQPNNAFVEEEISQPVHGVMLYQSADCTSGVERLRRLTVFGQNRQVLQRFNYGESGSLSQPQPGSSANAVLRYVCDRAGGEELGGG
ncbi:surface-adhesin E family protein [Microcoleus sp. FACHB-1515]|uniref:surface-adhesin E family protein n=1 Tax=Cyanophyceae TaxID=3028117 RepID=UPI001A7EA9A7|nr:surface-adhesin E family protein [Microcoleus sp. FACHB-1515]